MAFQGTVSLHLGESHPVHMELDGSAGPLTITFTAAEARRVAGWLADAADHAERRSATSPGGPF